MLSNHRKQPQEGTIPQQGACQTSGWEHMWQYRIQGQGYGTHGRVTKVGPHRDYRIQTTRERTLIRNHRFLHRGVPASLPPGTTQRNHSQRRGNQPAKQNQFPGCWKTLHGCSLN